METLRRYCHTIIITVFPLLFRMLFNIQQKSVILLLLFASLWVLYDLQHHQWNLKASWTSWCEWKTPFNRLRWWFIWCMSMIKFLSTTRELVRVQWIKNTLVLGIFLYEIEFLLHCIDYRALVRYRSATFMLMPIILHTLLIMMM